MGLQGIDNNITSNEGFFQLLNKAGKVSRLNLMDIPPYKLFFTNICRHTSLKLLAEMLQNQSKPLLNFFLLSLLLLLDRIECLKALTSNRELHRV